MLLSRKWQEREKIILGFGVKEVEGVERRNPLLITRASEALEIWRGYSLIFPTTYCLVNITYSKQMC